MKMFRNETKYFDGMENVYCLNPNFFNFQSHHDHCMYDMFISFAWLCRWQLGPSTKSGLIAIRVYPSKGRYVTNNILLLVVMISDVCMLTDALVPMFSWENKIVVVVHLTFVRVERDWTNQWGFLNLRLTPCRAGHHSKKMLFQMVCGCSSLYSLGPTNLMHTLNNILWVPKLVV